MLATLLEIGGFLLLVAAAYMVSLPLALLVAGVGLLAGAQALAPRRPERPLRRRRPTA